MKNKVIHASCISINGKAVLLMGESGSGKSDLALRLIDRGALLVADDYTSVSLERNILFASPPQNIAGLIEIRGMGVMNLSFVENIPLKFAVMLTDREKIERIPEESFFYCLDCKLPLIYLCAYDASSVAKIHFFMNMDSKNI